MDFDIEAWWAGSTVLQWVETIRNRGPDWADHAVTVTLARELLAPPTAEDADAADRSSGDAPAGTATPATEPPDESSDAPPTAPPSESDESPAPAPTADGDAVSSNTPWASSALYRAWVASRRFAKTSWLYRWLTAEPTPEVIVIDLRDTLAIAPVIHTLDRLIRDAIAVVPTSGWARLAYRLRARFFKQPIRILSAGVIAVVLVALLALTVSGATLGFEVIGLAAVLLVAARGTQSTYTWAQLTAMPWYQVLNAVVSPPEPPDAPAGDDVRASEPSE